MWTQGVVTALCTGIYGRWQQRRATCELTGQCCWQWPQNGWCQNRVRWNQSLVSRARNTCSSHRHSALLWTLRAAFLAPYVTVYCTALLSYYMSDCFQSINQSIRKHFIWCRMLRTKQRRVIIFSQTVAITVTSTLNNVFEYFWRKLIFWSYFGCRRMGSLCIHR